jgi:hypothetical protein
MEVASDVDYAVGRHAAQFGILLEGGHYRSDEASNTGGTFTFASLDAYARGREQLPADSRDPGADWGPAPGAGMSAVV